MLFGYAQIPLGRRVIQWDIYIYSIYYSFGPLPVISTYNPIYGIYNPIYSQLELINGHHCEHTKTLVLFQALDYALLLVPIEGGYPGR